MQSILETRSNGARGKQWQWLEYLLLTAGFVCLGWVGYSYAESYVYQSYENYALDEMVRGHRPSMTGYVESFFSKRSADMPADASDEDEQPSVSAPAQEQESAGAKTQASPVAPEPSGLIGRVEIPRLGISAIVREGVDSKTLKHAVGHVPHTALPGQNGNFAIAAHRDTFFRNLRGIRKGDRIHIVTPGGGYDYEVQSMKVVRPTSVEVLRPSGQPEVTLLTCYPFNYVGSAPKRFVVRARQIETEARSDAERAGS